MVDRDFPISLCLYQSLDLPLPGGVVRRDPPTRQAESRDPDIARVRMTSVTLPKAPGADPGVVWHLNIRGQKPGRITVRVRETTVTPPHKDQYALTLEVQVIAQKQQTGGLLLSGDGRENNLVIGGDLGWYQTSDNGSPARTGPSLRTARVSMSWRTSSASPSGPCCPGKAPGPGGSCVA